MSIKKKQQGKHAAGAVGAADATGANLDVTQAMAADQTVALDGDGLARSGAPLTQVLPAVDADEAARTVEATAVMPRRDADALAGFDVDSAGYPLGAPAAEANSYVSAGFQDMPERKRGRGAKAFFITFGVLAAVLAAAYVGIALMFSTQFMPNTRIDGLDISMKKDDEVAQIIQSIPEQYQIDVVGGNFSLRMTGEELGMTIDSDAIIKAMHEDQNPWYWPWYVTEANHDETFLVTTSYDKDACDKLVKQAVKKYNKKAQPPTDAYIFYDEQSQTFKVRSEEIGTQLAAKAVQKVVKAAVDEMEPKLQLTDEQLKQPKLLSTDEKLVSSAEMATGLVSAHLSLKINGNVVDEIGSETLSGFIQIGDDFDVTLDEAALSEWVNQLAASYDTIGMSRTYTRADGKVITVSGGTYGWEVDQVTLRDQILTSIKAGATTDIDIPCIDSANMYAGRGERDWGNRYIDVDLSEQHVRFYGDSGKIIWEADCISGSPDGEHDTPQGVWYVIMKQSPSKLIGYTEDGKKDYEADVVYWMPFMGNSVGFHDANWQPSFGGDMYAQGYGSHGCINLSTSDAKSLYKLIEPNDVVVVHV